MKNKLLFIPVACFFLLGVVLGSFYDLQINEALYIKNNIFGLAVASFAQLPVYGGAGFLGSVLFSVNNKQIKNKTIKWILYFISIVGVIFGIIMQGNAFVGVNAWGRLNPNLDKLYFAIPFGILLVGPFIVWGYFIGKKCENKDIIFVIFAMIFVYASQFVVIFILKSFFHRPRFRYIVENDITLFHNWWQPFDGYDTYKALGLSEEFKSFPSGHTGCATCMMIVLAYSGYFSKKFEDKQYMLFFIGFAYTILVGFSRMLVGAHFLSDVCMAGFIGTCAFAFFDIILDKFVFKKLNKLETEE